jgi:cold shock CspA family protein
VGRPVLSAGPNHGRVTAFDRDRGLGTVVDDAGASFGFHATAISDGSRNIAVGTQVAFTVSPGHGGRFEAASVLPVG